MCGGKGEDGRRRVGECVEGKGKNGRRRISECASSSTNTIASVHLVIKVFHERGLRARPVSLDALNTATQS